LKQSKSDIEKALLAKVKSHPPKGLVFSEETLGQGAHSHVHRATFFKTAIAVKQFKRGY